MSGASGGLPQLEIIDTQDSIVLDLDRVRAAALKALPLCLVRALPENNVLASLDEIEISIVTDEAIGRVHEEFLDDPTPTDVMTFDHGEILVSADTAAARAAEFDNAPDRELALYIIHGLLHLAGFCDKTDSDFRAMKLAQETILGEAW